MCKCHHVTDEQRLNQKKKRVFCCCCATSATTTTTFAIYGSEINILVFVLCRSYFNFITWFSFFLNQHIWEWRSCLFVYVRFYISTAIAINERLLSLACSCSVRCEISSFGAIMSTHVCMCVCCACWTHETRLTPVRIRFGKWECKWVGERASDTRCKYTFYVAYLVGFFSLFCFVLSWLKDNNIKETAKKEGLKLEALDFSI